jgi:hypothetical protein
MLERLLALWCERHGHRYQIVARLYSGAEGKAHEVLLEVCRVCGAQRDRPPTAEDSAGRPPLDEQARLDFLARVRRRALRRTARTSK